MDLISIVVPMAITDNLPVGVSLPKKSGGGKRITFPLPSMGENQNFMAAGLLQVTICGMGCLYCSNSIKKRQTVSLP